MEIGEKNMDEFHQYTVGQLSPYIKESWSLVGRVMCKNHVKYWKNLSSAGKLFDLLCLLSSSFFFFR